MHIKYASVFIRLVKELSRLFLFPEKPVISVQEIFHKSTLKIFTSSVGNKIIYIPVLSQRETEYLCSMWDV